MGRDMTCSWPVTRLTPFQSTRPHGARQCASAGDAFTVQVSIHAPAWGATPDGRYHSHGRHVSIHAPAWGATATVSPSLLALMPFQSTRPHGARPGRRSGTGRGLGGFNPRARMGRDPTCRLPMTSSRPFQSTRPHGARPTATGGILKMDQFQSTRPHGARLRDVGDDAVHFGVSIHAPAWGATTGGGGGALSCSRFNPRARMGRDIKSLSRIRDSIVSIHAPAWGATGTAGAPAMGLPVFQSTRPHGARRLGAVPEATFFEVSIHAPAWGATIAGVVRRRLKQVSIHAPAWGATELQGEIAALRAVSIHAPAWGATGRGIKVCSAWRVSIHAPAWGATAVALLLPHLAEVSIHAPAWGATRPSSTPSWARCGFNPRARMGRDSRSSRRLRSSSLFQSTRPHGARPALGAAVGNGWKFQSTRPHGARPGGETLAASGNEFQSTRPHGARRHGCSDQAGSDEFQSTRPHGARPINTGASPSTPGFNPRARMGRDKSPP